MNPDPIKVGFVFLGAALTSLGFGGVLLFHAWKGMKGGSYPLTKTLELTGLPARCAAFAIGVFGLVAVLCGVATLIFGWMRVQQLLQ